MQIIFNFNIKLRVLKKKLHDNIRRLRLINLKKNNDKAKKYIDKAKKYINIIDEYIEFNNTQIEHLRVQIEYIRSGTLSGGYKKIDYVKELSKLAVSNKKKYSDQLINEISKILNKYSESSGALLSGLQKPIKISIHKPKNKKKKGGAYNNIIDQLDPITNFAFM